MDGLREPLPALTRGLLRGAVRLHAAAETRRRYPPGLHLGVPGVPGGQVDLDLEDLDGAAADPGLRTDVVAALRVRAGTAVAGTHLVWLTRDGALDLQDADYDWLRATRSAYTEAAAGDPVFVVVNRRGWRDPRSGLQRTWARIRV